MATLGIALALFWQPCCPLPVRGGVAVAAVNNQPPSTVAFNVDRVNGMVWIPDSEFKMGSIDRLARRDERPVHRARVNGFWMDPTEVTNAQFAKFVKATGYSA
jgi:formylglycine-generating enzyme required for sulfatase activity